MGTRGAVGFIVNEQEKITYNHFDSYPDGLGIKTLAFLREFPGPIGELRRQAMRLKVVNNTAPPTTEQIEELRSFSDLNVGEQSEDDWYCLLRHTQGDWRAILDAGYMEDSSGFPLNSLFCEWAYIVNLDDETLEVYQGFQEKLPKAGRWKGRPTIKEDRDNHASHIAWCLANDREPWEPERSQYKAVELIVTYPLDHLPSDEVFVSELGEEQA